MGYFSELDINNTCYEDHSYPSPEMELRWRIEDLRNRLDEITNGEYGITAHYFMGFQFSKDDLAFAPPEYFSRASDIIDAIAIAEEKLAMSDYEESENAIRDILIEIDIEEIPGQLTIWDIPIDDSIDCPEERMEAAA